MIDFLRDPVGTALRRIAEIIVDSFEAVVTEGVLAILDAIPSVNLTFGVFLNIYAVMWGLAMILSIIASLIGFGVAMIRSETSLYEFDEPKVTPIRALTFWLQVFLFGQFLLLVVGLLVVFATAVTSAMLDVAKSEDIWRISQDMNLDGIGGVAGAVVALFAIMFVGFALVMATILFIEVVLALLGTYFTAVLAPPIFSLSILGESGMEAWRKWQALLLTTIFLEPVIALFLVVGLIIVLLGDAIVADGGIGDFVVALFSVATAGITIGVTAILAPWVTWSRMKKLPAITVLRDASGKISIAGVTADGEIIGGGLGGLPKAGAAQALGAIAIGGLIENQYDLLTDPETGEQSGGRSKGIGYTASAALIQSGNVIVGTVVGALTWLFGSKKGGDD